MSKPECLGIGTGDGRSWTRDALQPVAAFAPELSGANEPSAWVGALDLDVHEVLERATELTLIDWLELADVLAGHV
jgi:hypothetical protein